MTEEYGPYHCPTCDRLAYRWVGTDGGGRFECGKCGHSHVPTLRDFEMAIQYASPLSQAEAEVFLLLTRKGLV